jgi:hypothetical protein
MPARRRRHGHHRQPNGNMRDRRLRQAAHLLDHHAGVRHVHAALQGNVANNGRVEIGKRRETGNRLRGRARHGAGDG